MCPFCLPGCVFCNNSTLITITQGQFFTNSHVDYFKNWPPCLVFKSFFHIAFRSSLWYADFLLSISCLKSFNCFPSPTGYKALHINVLFGSLLAHLDVLLLVSSTLALPPPAHYSPMIGYPLLSIHLHPCCSSSLECPSMSYVLTCLKSQLKSCLYVSPFLTLSDNVYLNPSL